jgi:hypothetical protein
MLIGFSRSEPLQECHAAEMVLPTAFSCEFIGQELTVALGAQARLPKGSLALGKSVQAGMSELDHAYGWQSFNLQGIQRVGKFGVSSEITEL